VAEACGTPLPAPPSRALPITFIAAGGVSFIAGGVVGLLALNTEATLRGKLSTDDLNRSVVLDPADSYRRSLAETALQRSSAPSRSRRCSPAPRWSASASS